MMMTWRRRGGSNDYEADNVNMRQGSLIERQHQCAKIKTIQGHWTYSFVVGVFLFVSWGMFGRVFCFCLIFNACKQLILPSNQIRRNCVSVLCFAADMKGSFWVFLNRSYLVFKVTHTVLLRYMCKILRWFDTKISLKTRTRNFNFSFT